MWPSVCLFFSISYTDGHLLLMVTCLMLHPKHETWIFIFFLIFDIPSITRDKDWNFSFQCNSLGAVQRVNCYFLHCFVGVCTCACVCVCVYVSPIPLTYLSDDSQMLSSLLKSRLGRRSWGNSSSSLSSRSPAALRLSSTPAMTGMSERTWWDSRLSWLVVASASSALSSLWVKLSARASACGTNMCAGSEQLAGVSAALDMIESLVKHVAGQDGKIWFPQPVTVSKSTRPCK